MDPCFPINFLLLSLVFINLNNRCDRSRAETIPQWNGETEYTPKMRNYAERSDFGSTATSQVSGCMTC
jgi:hypothetical protein